MIAHAFGGLDNVTKPLRTGVPWVSHVDVGYPHPTTSDITTVAGVHLAIHSPHTLWCANVVVSSWSGGITLVQFFAGCGMDAR